MNLIGKENALELILTSNPTKYFSMNSCSLLLHYFDNNFVKATTVKEELISRNMILVFPHCALNTQRRGGKFTVTETKFRQIS